VSAQPSPLWFVDRSAGEITLLLMSAVVILGIVRSALPASMPLIVEGLHINIAFLTVIFGGLHLLGAILDPFARLGLIDALVPFVSAYRGAWLGLGVISAYLYVAALVTSGPQRRIPRVYWLWLHRLMYAGWGIALVHSLGTGSDVRNEVFLLLNIVAVAAVLVAFLAFRVTEGWKASPRLWGAVAAAAIVLTLGVAVWAAAGPMQPGWARSSGTPPDLLNRP